MDWKPCDTYNRTSFDKSLIFKPLKTYRLRDRKLMDRIRGKCFVFCLLLAYKHKCEILWQMTGIYCNWLQNNIIVSTVLCVLWLYDWKLDCLLVMITVKPRVHRVYELIDRKTISVFILITQFFRVFVNYWIFGWDFHSIHKWIFKELRFSTNTRLNWPIKHSICSQNQKHKQTLKCH